VNGKESYHILQDTSCSAEPAVLKLVTVKLPEAILEGLDELVKAGMYQSRSAAIRAAVRDMLKKELWRTEET
jgi:Arc/MetJ-type ribon-helix-helix transcriptional regulator